MTNHHSGGVRATPDDWLSIGEVSARTGAAVSALRFYEELGLIASERDDRNQRRYPRHMLRRVALVSVAKRIGIPLQDLREAFADVPLDRPPSHQEVAARLAELEASAGGAQADHRAARGRAHRVYRLWMSVDEGLCSAEPRRRARRGRCRAPAAMRDGAWFARTASTPSARALRKVLTGVLGTPANAPGDLIRHSYAGTSELASHADARSGAGRSADG